MLIPPGMSETDARRPPHESGYPREGCRKGGVMTKALITFSVKAAFIICLFSALIFVPPGTAVHGAEPIRLGAVLSLSGKGGFVGPLVGTPMKEAMTAVVEEVNRNGGVLGR